MDGGVWAGSQHAYRSLPTPEEASERFSRCVIATQCDIVRWRPHVFHSKPGQNNQLICHVLPNSAVAVFEQWCQMCIKKVEKRSIPIFLAQILTF